MSIYLKKIECHRRGRFLLKVATFTIYDLADVQCSLAKDYQINFYLVSIGAAAFSKF